MLTREEETELRMLSPITLAFLGDAVYELLVRDQLSRESAPAGKLHQKAVRQVCCSAQAAGYDTLLPVLTEEEATILRRGRNANSTRVPKNAKPQEYRKATGVEALFGYLYRKGEMDRLRELFALMQQAAANPVSRQSQGVDEPQWEEAVDQE